jgi:hypothetical protein
MLAMGGQGNAFCSTRKLVTCATPLSHTKFPKTMHACSRTCAACVVRVLCMCCCIQVCDLATRMTAGTYMRIPLAKLLTRSHTRTLVHARKRSKVGNLFQVTRKMAQEASISGSRSGKVGSGRGSCSCSSSGNSTGTITSTSTSSSSKMERNELKLAKAAAAHKERTWSVHYWGV